MPACCCWKVGPRWLKLGFPTELALIVFSVLVATGVVFAACVFR
jgi:hypothetical protein